ncbi:MAG: acryloyl-CoA reductase [Ilumatobacteraceae bacterium]
MTSTTRALLVGKVNDVWTRRIEGVSLDALGDGDVLVKVDWSCINYKDGLASSEKGRVARIDPLIPGVDLAGTIVDAGESGLAVGSPVIVHGYDVGVAHHGGYAAYARVSSKWVVPMPSGLTTKTSMMVGTAGFTAALSVDALERAGLHPGTGPVLVTGSTGGVGSYAVGMLAARGYEVVASTGKASAADWLRSIGASDVIDRSETSAEQAKPLEKERWAGVVDCVGGSTLAYALRTTRYGGSVAASGLTGGSDLHTTVMPFILRGVNLLGIDSVQVDLASRIAMWARIGSDLKPTWLDSQESTVLGLEELAPHLDAILKGDVTGRLLVDPNR